VRRLRRTCSRRAGSKERIVSEASRAARLMENGPFHRAAVDAAQAAVFHQSDGADKAGRPVLGAAQFFEEQPVVGFVIAVMPAVPGGADSRLAGQSIHLQARIVGEKEKRSRLAGESACPTCLARVVQGLGARRFPRRWRHSPRAEESSQTRASSSMQTGACAAARRNSPSLPGLPVAQYRRIKCAPPSSEFQ